LINVQSYVKVWQSKFNPHCFELRKSYSTMLKFTHYQFCFDKDHQTALAKTKITNLHQFILNKKIVMID
jgi:hypothetical protein